MAQTIIATVCVLLAMTIRGIESNAGTMKDLTSGFLKVLEECKNELNLAEPILRDLYHYWKEDYSLLNRDTGCAIICMSKKLELLDASGKLHHGNAQEFAMQHGAESEMAAKLVAVIHECEQKYEAMEDECLRVLEVAKCFRTAIHELNWTPKMDVMISEVLSEF